MSKVLIQESNLQAIAAAIRQKSGSSTTYKPRDMAAAVQAIPTGRSPVLEPLNVTTNGVYTPETGIDGFSNVNVSVDMNRAPVLYSNTFDSSNIMSEQNSLICTLNGRSYTKVFNGPALAAYYHTTDNYTSPLLISEVEESVTYKTSYDNSVFNARTTVNYNGKTYFVNGISYLMDGLRTSSAGFAQALDGKYARDVTGLEAAAVALLTLAQARTRFTQNGFYPIPNGYDGFAPVEVALQLYSNLTINGYIDTSTFNRLYSTSVPYGSSGSKVDSVLALGNEEAIQNNMLRGSSGLHAEYDSENKIGAYGGYSSESPIPAASARFYLGRFSAQNKTLTVTVEYLDGDGVWHEVEDLDISPSLPSPLNYFDVLLPTDATIYGVRWIHKKEPIKSSSNNVFFYGMVLKSIPAPLRAYQPETTGLIMPPSGYTGFGPLYIP